MDSLLGHKKLDTAKGTEHARPQEREGLASPSGQIYLLIQYLHF